MKFAHRVWHDWPMLFTWGVAIYFVLAAITLTLDVPSVPGVSNLGRSNSPSGETPTAATSNEKAGSGAFSFRVVAFRIVPDRSQVGVFVAEVTVEVENTGTDNAFFRPAALALRNGYGDSATPFKPELTRMAISPQVGQLVSIGFRIEPVPGSDYTLSYQGREIYTGMPR